MSALEEAREALRKRQEAADEVLTRERERFDHTLIGSNRWPAADYIEATSELAEQWLRLAAIEAGHNPYVNNQLRRSNGTLPAPGLDYAKNADNAEGRN